MAGDIRDTPVVRATRDLLTNLSDLFRKELRLAQAEMRQAAVKAAQAGAWMAVAGIAALIVVLLLVQAAIFAIASLGLALHWATLIVAAILAAVAAAAFFYGRSLARDGLAPKRTVNQINRDIATLREQLR
jgi:small-conductance mechanosensitive channel